MDVVWTENIDAVLAKGRSLQDLGIKNWALQRADAISALQDLDKLGVGVLGGDVFVLKSGGLAPNYDNWSCSPALGEEKESYVRRSIRAAQSYIEGYTCPDGQVLFAFVPYVGEIAR